MYTGYVKVDEDTDSNLFYWLYNTQSSASSSPLIIWMNGGPGTSSQYGNLLTNGPLRFIKNSDGNSELISVTDYSWTKSANMLYLDQPIGTGFSYGHLEVTTHRDVTKLIIKFITEFYKIHPELKSKDLYLAGEDYAAKYITNVASEIREFNRRSAVEEKVILKGVIIGKPEFDKLGAKIYLKETAVALGKIQFDSLRELDALEKLCEESVGSKYANATSNCDDVNFFLDYMEGSFDTLESYDSQMPSMSWWKQTLIEYFNSEAVIDQLHISDNFKFDRFSLYNSTVYQMLESEVFDRNSEDVVALFESGLPVLLFLNTMDQEGSAHQLQEYINHLEWSNGHEFKSSITNLYYYIDKNDAVKLGGNFVHSKNLYLMVVYSMHADDEQFPTTAVPTTVSMVADFVNSQSLQCHNATGKCSLEAVSCEFMNNCNGKGSCVKGKCQ